MSCFIQEKHSIPAGAALLPNEPPSLSPLGQGALTTITSLIVNGVTHPLCTIKNRKMTGQPIGNLGSLYQGFLAINGVDSASFFIGYGTKESLEEKVGKFWASISAAVASTPAIAVGEGLMIGRQINALPYAQCIERAFRVSGLFASVCKEIPFNLAIFYLTPKLKELLDHTESETFKEAIAGLLAGIAEESEMIPENWSKTKDQIKQEITEMDDDTLKELAAGFLSGLLAGWITTPIDFIKTNVQSSPNKTTIRKVIKDNIDPQPLKDFIRTPFRNRISPLQYKMQQKALHILKGKNKVLQRKPPSLPLRQAVQLSGIPRFFKGGGTRALYVGASAAIMSLTYSQLPKLLPDFLKKT